jgi:hypothetical protein
MIQVGTLYALLSGILYGRIEDVALTPDFDDTLNLAASVLGAALIC